MKLPRPGAVLVVLLAGSSTGAFMGQRPDVPRIVFVSRHRPAEPGVIPGLGPTGRTLAVGGTLMIRSAWGTAVPLVPKNRFFDVSDPAVSYDGKWVAFAATVAPDSAWRIWVVGGDGTGLLPVTHSDREPLDLPRAVRAQFERYDDFDPCWLQDDRICFASTRYPEMAEEGGVRASNLYVVRRDGTGLERITSERNGAESPTVDPRNGRIVFARWWRSRYFPSESDPRGVTTDRARAVPADTVDLWHAISVVNDGDGMRLAGGDPRTHAGTAAYQPLVLDDGTLVAVSAGRSSLVPTPGAVAVRMFPHGFDPPVFAPWPHGKGPDAHIVPACAPSYYTRNRILLACDPHGDGDWGIYTVSIDGSDLRLVVDYAGTDELDARALTPRPRPFRYRTGSEPLPTHVPPTDLATLYRAGYTFRFDCLNVFANAPVDAPIPDAPPLARDVRIRFYAILARPGETPPDTVVLVREEPVERSGAVHEPETPAGVPLFEQLVDAHGHVLRSASGPAHVPGSNPGRFGGGTKCVGCHLGHSAIPVARSAFEGKRFNASPSARVTASSVLEGTVGGRGAVDRRTLGPAQEVAWIAAGQTGESLRLDWNTTIAVDSLILYALSPSSSGTDLLVRECDLSFFLKGQVVAHQTVRAALSAHGTGVSCGGVRADAVEIRPNQASGKVLGKKRVGLAEVATIARIAEE